jgi:membrane peptidoglycan carboxypeptidase
MWASIIMLDFIVSLFFRSFIRWRYQELAEYVLLKVRELTIKDDVFLDDIDILIDALVYAEDHRFYSHYGIDTRSIARAVALTALTRKVQGGSTITQQLTRVIVGDYSMTVARKFKEICLASWLNNKVSKHEQAVAYLEIAYFGWRMNGWRQAVNRLKISTPCSMEDAAGVVARLKYPEPRNPNLRQTLRIQSRKKHIIKLMEMKR